MYSLLSTLKSLGSEFKQYSSDDLKNELKNAILSIPEIFIKKEIRHEILQKLQDMNPSESLAQVANVYNELPDKALQMIADKIDPGLFNMLMSQGDLMASNITQALGLSAKGGVRQRKKKAKQEESTEPKKKSHKEIQETVKQRKQKEAELTVTNLNEQLKGALPANVETNPTIDSPIPVSISNDSKQKLQDTIINLLKESKFEGVGEQGFIDKILKQVKKSSKYAKSVKSKKLEEDIKKAIIIHMTRGSDRHLLDSSHTWDGATIDKLYKLSTGDVNRQLMMSQIGRVVNLRDQKEKLCLS